MGLGSHGLDPKALLKAHQTQTIRLLSITASTFSIVGCLVTIYWFILMKRNFRRVLILILILADLFKATWFLVFAAFALNHNIENGSAFCLAGGFFIQTGLESCDVAILFMSMHMSMQILSTKQGSGGLDGLYRWRYYVYAALVVIPSFMAALAFVDGRGAYLSQGAFCTLPIRPFWYRLALSWIPRYLIWAYVIYVIIRIHLRVGSGIRVFARRVDNSSANAPDSASTPPSHVAGPKGTGLGLNLPSNDDTSYDLQSIARPTLGDRRSSVHWQDLECHNSENDSSPNSSNSHVRSDARDSMIITDSVAKESSSNHKELHALSPITELNGAPLQPIDSLFETSNDRSANKRRRAIQRQIRLLFIYPCVYMIFMIMPFVSHCFNYSDYYAQHPNFVVTALGIFCFAFMGFADCLVFCWRERPWSHIPGSDGTFIGSFCFWQFNRGRPADMHVSSIAAPETSPATNAGSSSAGGSGGPSPDPMNGPAKTLKPHPAYGRSHGGSSNRRVFSGKSERANLAAEQAAERLRLEREEARMSRQSMMMGGGAQQPQSKPAREWYDRRESLFDDDPLDSTESLQIREEGFIEEDEEKDQEAI